LFILKSKSGENYSNKNSEGRKMQKEAKQSEGFKMISKRCSKDDCQITLDDEAKTCPKCGGTSISFIFEVSHPDLLPTLENSFLG